MFGGVEHLMIFAQPSHGTSQPIIARVPGAPDNQSVDFSATGAIPEDSKPPAPPTYTLPSINAPKEQIVKDFTLRGVSGNVAVVEGADGIYRVELGSTLPGGSRVLSIEWRQGKFVVVTTQGIIREALP